MTILRSGLTFKYVVAAALTGLPPSYIPSSGRNTGSDKYSMSGGDIMRRIRQLPVATLVVLLAAFAGCDRGTIASPVSEITVPLGIAGTIAQYAHLVGGNEMLVRGYGVVVGLGDKGSAEVPGAWRSYLIKEMRRKGVGSHAADAGALTPTRMLRDPDTAVVIVSGWLPPAAPVGTRFDLYVECPGRTQTMSLDGGYLMPADLRFALAGSITKFAQSRRWGTGKGQVFVDPSAARQKTPKFAAVRHGVIPNGGVVTREKPIRLELHEGHYPRANAIQRLLKERFDNQSVAVATSPSLVELHIPRRWRYDYAHFLRLLMHVYIVGGSGAEGRHARDLAKAILRPKARADDISLVWEAMGKQTLPVVRELYTSANEVAAFYSARAGLRLGDSMAMEPMLRLAERTDSPAQILAVKELGRTPRSLRAISTLKDLLSSKNELLRVAAYESLVRQGPGGLVKRSRVGSHFTVDIVDTKRDYAIYATRTGRPRIVLFGANIPIRKPIFFAPPDELVTIIDRPAKADAPKIKPIRIEPSDNGVEIHLDDEEARKSILFYRKLPKGDRKSELFYVAPLVNDLIVTMGLRPEHSVDGGMEGMGLTYSQIVGILEGMCKSGSIPAKFVLQESPRTRRIYSSVPGIGRPDKPEEGS